MHRGTLLWGRYPPPEGALEAERGRESNDAANQTTPARAGVETGPRRVSAVRAPLAEGGGLADPLAQEVQLRAACPGANSSLASIPY